ncbi:DUF4129 domain-containing protein [Haloactinopolyspora sp.]|uniref:DUF4129 domain-containing protein n=1 Tax=Haloactinopolyspora sp. TaxID=1966353 RepID=UPI002631613E|nr:DUF4129 domain-containing protein [Haloactinopolyspora sp.]
MRGTDRSAKAWTATAVLMVCAVVVIVAAGLGPINVVEPGWLSEADGFDPDERTMPRELPTTTMTMTWPTERPTDTGTTDFPWNLALVAILVAVVVLVLMLIRGFPRPGWRRARRSVVGGTVEAWPDAAEDLRAGARTASGVLEGSGSADAQTVIEAWLALESAAAGSGAARDPAQTPTEFTAALLRRHHADEVATSMLLGLYHRARFSAHPDIGVDDVAAARSALATILRTLSSHTTPMETPS